jgi:hypothetical protein
LATNVRGDEMKAAAKKISPEDYILSALPPEDRLDAAFKVAGEAFKKTTLTMKDVENAVKTVRRKVYEKKK